MDELGFTYFPGDYRWSHGMLLALNSAPWGGGEIGEVHRVGLALKDKIGDDRAWFAAWEAASESAPPISGIGLLTFSQRTSAR